ncbi:hypothetical protein PQR66_27320 [Paraburkholderia agricolaris]|uniref:Transposase n=1 Tax=Paraburkholderia agricolaris TaxID=2152888 RepID=A0ABW8ZVE1_9BURK
MRNHLILAKLHFRHNATELVDGLSYEKLANRSIVSHLITRPTKSLRDSYSHGMLAVDHASAAVRTQTEQIFGHVKTFGSVIPAADISRNEWLIDEALPWRGRETGGYPSKDSSDLVRRPGCV